MSEFKTVGNVGDIKPGAGKAFEFGEQMVAVFLETDGTYLAIDDLCPHMGASLASGHFSEGVVTCPWHAWSFDARDGAWCDNRRLKIDTFQVRIKGDEIQLATVESDESNASAGSALGGASYGGRISGNGAGKTKECDTCDSNDATGKNKNSLSNDALKPASKERASEERASKEQGSNEPEQGTEQ